jgi:steroid 5-alpha reductase family enzyme
MVVLWSLRLAIHLLVRVASHHPVEDVRYARLREEWGGRADFKMFRFFQLQGALQVVLSLPVAIIDRDATEPGEFHGMGVSGIAGLAIWLIGLAGESIADRQLAGFRSNPQNKGRVCQAGLWKYSRHPNYFFEWLIWVGYAVFALGSPMGWLGLVAPALMLHFLVNVTGVPMTEELSVKSKGDAYREYQRTTSAFVPWFPKPAVNLNPVAK